MYLCIYVCTLFKNEYTVKTPEPIFINDGSKDAVRRAVWSLRQDNLISLNLSEQLPPEHPKFRRDRKIPAKKNISLNTCPAKTPEPIFIIDGLKDVVWRKEVPFRHDKEKYSSFR